MSCKRRRIGVLAVAFTLLRLQLLLLLLIAATAVQPVNAQMEAYQDLTVTALDDYENAGIVVTVRYRLELIDPSTGVMTTLYPRSILSMPSGGNVEVAALDIDDAANKVTITFVTNVTAGTNQFRLLYGSYLVVANETLSYTPLLYTKSHVIGPASGAGTGYQIQLTAYYGSGTDNGNEVYLNGKCRSDFGDIRFFSSGGAELSYWMAYKVDGAYAVFWVKVDDDLSTNSSIIYMKYGNPSATSMSNGTATFIVWLDMVTAFYDQFGELGLTTYSNGVDPGDGFAGSASSGGTYFNPCLWFRSYGGEKHSRAAGVLHFEGYTDGGNGGGCGMDVRIRSDSVSAGWKTTNTYAATTTYKGRHIVAIDYVRSGSGSAVISFRSTWSGTVDEPVGTAAATVKLNATSRSFEEYVYTGSVMHTDIRVGGPGADVYQYYYAVAKSAAAEPAHLEWGAEVEEAAVTYGSIVTSGSLTVYVPGMVVQIIHANTTLDWSTPTPINDVVLMIHDFEAGRFALVILPIFVMLAAAARHTIAPVAAITAGLCFSVNLALGFDLFSTALLGWIGAICLLLFVLEGRRSD